MLFSKDNPWIYSNYPEPTNNNYYLVSAGLGVASVNLNREDHEETTSFKYAMFAQTSNEVYSGYSISGYSQSWNYRSYFYNSDYNGDYNTISYNYEYKKSLLP